MHFYNELKGLIQVISATRTYIKLSKRGYGGIYFLVGTKMFEVPISDATLNLVSKCYTFNDQPLNM